MWDTAFEGLISFLFFIFVKTDFILVGFQFHICCCLVTQSCLTLCDLMDCSPPGSSVHGILQARILGCVAIPFSRDFPDPGIEPGSSYITGSFFTIWATREDLSQIWTPFKAIVVSSIKYHQSSFYNNKHNSYNFTTKFFSAFHIDTQSIQFRSFAQLCPTFCDPMNRSMPGLPVHHQLPESTQTHVHRVGDVIQPSHLILCHPLLLLPSIFPSIRVFSDESALCIRWPKYWSFSFSIIPSTKHPGLISFRMDWLDLLAVQGTLKSLLQHHGSKASILWRHWSSTEWCSQNRWLADKYYWCINTVLIIPTKVWF